MPRHTQTGLLRRTALAGLATAVVAPWLTVTPASAQKTTITFAGVTFSEAGRGDKLRAWVDTFNKSQDKIQVDTLGLPFATFANTMFTQKYVVGGLTAGGVKG